VAANQEAGRVADWQSTVAGAGSCGRDHKARSRGSSGRGSSGPRSRASRRSSGRAQWAVSAAMTEGAEREAEDQATDEDQVTEAAVD
jgi:hypothetical protein